MCCCCTGECDYEEFWNNWAEEMMSIIDEMYTLEGDEEEENA